MNRTTSPSLTTVVGIFAILGAITWAQHDDARVRQADEARAKAAAAEHRRTNGAARACGPNAEPVWIDSGTVQCLHRVDAATVARSTL